MALKTDLSTEEIIKSIAFAKNNRAQIINASWGGSSFDELLYESIADFAGLFVAAAGNNSGDNDTDPRYPASYDLPNIIAVAATDTSDELASFSNYGQTSVDIAAPGQGIISTYANAITLANHDFEVTIPPALPVGFTSLGTWATIDTGVGNALVGDLSHFPYISNNDSSVTEPGSLHL